MPPTEKLTRRLTFRVDEQTIGDLERHAIEIGADSLGAVVRDAIRRHLRWAKSRAGRRAMRLQELDSVLKCLMPLSRL